MEDLRLEITIERPTADDPYGHIGLVASSLAPLPAESLVYCQNATDGSCTAETLNHVIADVWSYFLNGQQSFARRIERRGESRDR